ncbi:hypothetical protein GCM10012275_38270 [Longimycelium tulufanense]|uniref:Uncharacterized protein n=1 Tax=Longimycelium tulufanense TaxID=907463 RepID=A0A8J3CAB0_9PSEU|nr:hypothetical protein [Longimycelium tulufanense]GGM64092.1 hypothetical protein GCM10012275_38270 [Longimycelium tulufanense]
MRVVYDGPARPGVEIPILGLIARYGEPVEVPDAIGAALLHQKCWREAPQSKPTRVKSEKEVG